MPNRVPFYLPAGTVTTTGLPEGEPGVGSTTGQAAEHRGRGSNVIDGSFGTAPVSE